MRVLAGDYSDGFAIKDLSSNTLPNAPEYTFKLGLNYQASIIGGDLLLRGEYYYQDDVYFTEWNRQDAYQEGYGLLNARAVYTLPGERWSFAVWGRNLADEEIVSTTSSQPRCTTPSSGLDVAAAHLRSYGEFRVLGLSCSSPGESCILLQSHGSAASCGSIPYFSVARGGSIHRSALRFLGDDAVRRLPSRVD